MARLERADMETCSPQLNEPREASYWLEQPGSPKPERPDEEPETVPYEELLQQWTGDDSESSNDSNGGSN